MMVCPSLQANTTLSSMLLPIPLKELELNPNMQPNAGW